MSKATIRENLNGFHAIFEVKKCKNLEITSTFDPCDLENRSPISLPTIWMVSSNNLVNFEWNAHKCLGEKGLAKLQATGDVDAASQMIQTHIA